MAAAHEDIEIMRAVRRVWAGGRQDLAPVAQFEDYRPGNAGDPRRRRAPKNRRAMNDVTVDGSAVLSPCGRYRYELERRWGDGKPIVWIMLNPSTADHIENDATIRKCIGFTIRLGYNALKVVNLFAFRARDPKVMRAAADPVGLENDRHIAEAVASSARTICSWGPNGRHLDRDRQVLKWLRENGIETHCLRVTSDGSPGHPLLLPYAVSLIPYRHLCDACAAASASDQES